MSYLSRLVLTISLMWIASVNAQTTAPGDRNTTESGGVQKGACAGKYPNPVSDICWLCMFPIEIGPVSLNYDQEPNGDPPPPLLCGCPAPPPVFYRIGLGISWWEPYRVAEVVRTPGCFPSLGGEVLFDVDAPDGAADEGAADGAEEAFYQVHWITYPVLNWLGMAVNSSICMSNDSYDFVYLTEIDPLWDDDQLSFILNPETILFSNLAANAACIADSVKADFTNFGIDTLYWCSGGQGSVYPLTGNVDHHQGGVDTSALLTHRMNFRLHRLGLGQDTSTDAAMCATQYQPVMRKKQYKISMMYPRPMQDYAVGYGKPSYSWGAGREYPYKGEDFAYLVWRKRKCCAW